VAEDDIVYVATGGTNGVACGSQASPCKTISGAQGGLAKVTVSRKTVHVGPGLYNESVTVTGGVTAILVGPGATISPGAGSNAAGLVVDNGSDVTVDGLALANATGGTDADGVRCSGSTSAVTILGSTIENNDATGVEVFNCAVIIERSTISANDGGGASITGSAFTIRNNFIASNGVAGAAGSLFGGVAINNGAAQATQVFEFNTVADSKARDAALGAGVNCQVTTPMAASNNIVYLRSGASAMVFNIGCTWTYSDIEDLAGTGNIDEDPDFIDAMNGNFHLQSTSPCRNTADPAATLGEDFDGDDRPQGGRHDMGADEVVE
jgi:hypothetical protein